MFRSLPVILVSTQNHEDPMIEDCTNRLQYSLRIPLVHTKWPAIAGHSTEPSNQEQPLHFWSIVRIQNRLHNKTTLGFGQKPKTCQHVLQYVLSQGFESIRRRLEGQGTCSLRGCAGSRPNFHTSGAMIAVSLLQSSTPSFWIYL